jgi:hypothetical protein
MIVEKLNLVCTAGHRYYAPLREIDAWIRKECTTSGSTNFCRGTLRKIEAPMNGERIVRPRA